MPLRLRHFYAALLACLPLAGGVAQAADAGALWRDSIQPLLDENCVKCHGVLKQKSGLVLDSVEGILKGNEDGAVVKPGEPGASPLLAALTAEADPHMPPKKQLPPEQISQVRDWITALGQAGSPEAKAAPAKTFPADGVPAAAIDYFLAEGWKERGVTATPTCDDQTFLRRLMLDLAGRLPNPAETDVFLADTAPERRAQLIERLLASDDYARHLRETWDVLLMGRGSGRREQRRQESGWTAFLENSFRKDRPWNEMVRAMIVARPGAPEDRGAFWFLYEKKDQHQQIAEAIAPIIYGTQVSCAQCHDHPLAREIKQGHYWGLVAAFNRSKNNEKGPQGVGESAVGGFINFTNLKKESQPAVITMLSGRVIEEARPEGDAKPSDPPEGYVDPAAAVKVPKFSRRGALAEAATQENPLLARAFVNYNWALLMGRGIVHPVDEINSRHPASHPELLEWLATDLAAHGYDTRRLVRAIVSSRAYALAPAPLDSTVPVEAFAAAAEKPLIAETIARSLQVAAGREEEAPAVRKVFAEAFPEVLPRVPRATIQGAMLLANNQELTTLFEPAPGSTASRLAGLPTPEERVRAAFWAVLIRAPDAGELAQGVEYLNARADHPAEAAGQLLWALATGPEFLTNH